MITNSLFVPDKTPSSLYTDKENYILQNEQEGNLYKFILIHQQFVFPSCPCRDNSWNGSSCGEEQHAQLNLCGEKLPRKTSLPTLVPQE